MILIFRYVSWQELMWCFSHNIYYMLVNILLINNHLAIGDCWHHCFAERSNSLALVCSLAVACLGLERRQQGFRDWLRLAEMWVASRTGGIVTRGYEEKYEVGSTSPKFHQLFSTYQHSATEILRFFFASLFAKCLQNFPSAVWIFHITWLLHWSKWCNKHINNF
jgi:hypothetical protein